MQESLIKINSLPKVDICEPIQLFIVFSHLIFTVRKTLTFKVSPNLLCSSHSFFFCFNFVQYVKQTTQMLLHAGLEH